MEVEYELTPEDIREFHAYYRRHPPAARRRLDPLAGIVLLVMCTLGCLAFGAAIALHMDSLALLLIGASFGVCIGSVFENWHLKRMTAPRKLVEKGNDAAKILGWARVLIDAQGVHVTDRFFSCHYGWNGLEKLETTDEYVFFYVTTSLAQIVPMRAFADGRAFDAFADEAKRHHAAARVSKAERPRPTGIQTLEQASKPGTVEGIIPREGV